MRKKRSFKVPTIHSFFGEKAEEYGTSRWMARIQEKTTRRALQLLQDERIGGLVPEKEKQARLILDLGCGNGYSTRVIIEENYFNVVGIDLSFDMLSNSDQSIDYPKIQADMRYLPIRKSTFDILLSISAINFMSQEILDTKRIFNLYKALALEIKRVLKSYGGKAVIEFYPKDEQELAIISRAFGKTVAGWIAYLVIDGKGTRKEQKFLIVRT
ncbi:MAG: methyltransferase domain-containing protein [Promethearchaeota archaeon]